jgi:L-alanine-DL-glutamate epimerase-like enolase superfamily enzyme
MKIGAIKFDEELEVLKFIRGVENNNMTLRVDANGAFSMAEVFNKLDLLARYRIHSIEQPIKPGSWESMAEICRLSPIPIALDEELIGMSKRKEEMLDNIQPQFIVLKPTLLGGFKETGEWIDLAEKLGIGWWITSMLESNIGLNAITQFAAGKAPKLIHGLGTGKLYSNNVGSPLSIQNGEISYLLEKKWDYSIFPDL